MNWQEKLSNLEQDKEWDAAIDFMQKIVHANPESIDAYLSILYLLMNLLVEEDHDESKHDYYEKLAKLYFDESYKKFHQNPEYLYYAGRIAGMSEWYVGIDDIKEVEKMIEDAARLDPKNLIYKWIHLYSLARKNIGDERVVNYAKLILQEDSPIKKILEKKGALGEYLLVRMDYWAKKILDT